MKHVDIYTDGACKGNPGPGGYGAIIVYGKIEKIISGGSSGTTNNRMELSAVIAGLSALKEPCDVSLYTDSKYIVDSIEKGWLKSWKSKNWIKSNKDPVLNVDLWETVLKFIETHNIKVIWVKGHAGNPYNERCDELAVSEAKKFER